MAANRDIEARHTALTIGESRVFLAPARGAVLRAVILAYVAFAAAYAVALVTGTLWADLSAFAVAVAVQTRLAILTHEGAHGLLHRRRRANDLLTNWLAAFPIGLTVETFRRSHLPHHAHLGTTADPDFVALCVPPLRRGLLASVVGCLSGWRQLQLLMKYLRETPARSDAPMPSAAWSLCGRIVWQGALFAPAMVAGRPAAYLGLWVLPLVTFGVLINELRSIVEHTPILGAVAPGEAVRVPALTRTVRAGWVARAFFAPLGFHYHQEHHLHPAVPFSRLPELHAAFVDRGYYARHPELLCDGYRQILRRLWSEYGTRGPAITIVIENEMYVARA